MDAGGRLRGILPDGVADIAECFDWMGFCGWIRIAFIVQFGFKAILTILANQLVAQAKG
jgi:hypothetical protein